VPYLTLLVIVATFAAIGFVTYRDIDRGLAATFPGAACGAGASLATIFDRHPLALLVAIAGAVLVYRALSARGAVPTLTHNVVALETRRSARRMGAGPRRSPYTGSRRRRPASLNASPERGPMTPVERLREIVNRFTPTWRVGAQ
jgi:hypothetical protein